jgi:uncharacterized small protein (DUF1192 family)
MTRRPTGKRRGRPAIAKPTVLPVADAKPFLPIGPESPPAEGWQQSPWQPLAPSTVLKLDSETATQIAAIESTVREMRSEVASLLLHVVPEGVNQLARTIDALDTSFVALRDGIAQLRSLSSASSDRQAQLNTALQDKVEANTNAMVGVRREMDQLGTHTDPVAAGMIGDIHRIMQEWSRTLFPHLANETNKRITSLQAEIEQLRLALDKKAKRKAKKAERDDAKAKRRVAGLFGPSARAAEARVGELDKARREAKR